MTLAMRFQKRNSIWLLPWFAALLLSGAWLRGQSSPPSFQGAAPSTLDASTARKIAANQRAQTTASVLKFGSFGKPTALCVAPNGNVLVFDASTPASVKTFSPEGRELKSQSVPAMPDGSTPSLMAATSDGAIFVAQARSAHVFRLNENAAPTVAAKREKVLGLAIQGDALWILGGANDGLTRINLKDNSTRKIALSSFPRGELIGLKLRPDGDFYTYAPGERLVWHFDAKGALLEKIGGGAPPPPHVGAPASHIGRFFDVADNGALFWTLGDYGALLQITADGKTAVHFNGRESEKATWTGNVASLLDFAVSGERGYVLDQMYKRVTALPLSWAAPGAPKTRQVDTRTFGMNFRLVSDAPYKLFTTSQAKLKIAFEDGNRSTPRVEVITRLLDYHGALVSENKSTLDVPKSGAPRLDLTPIELPKLGWYQAEVSLRDPTDGKVFLRRAHFFGRTFLDPEQPIPDKEYTGWYDLHTHRMIGMGLYRFALHNVRQIDELADEIARARQMKVPYYVLLINAKDATPEGVRYVVEKLKSCGDNAPLLEIINEPNLNMSAAAYTEILKRCVPAIREVSPQTKIMGPSQCGTELGWFESFLKSGADLVDVVSIHTYERHNSMDAYHWQKKFSRLGELMKQYAPGKPLYQTEHGFMGDYHSKITRPQWQARQLTLELNVLDRFGIDKDKYLYYYVNEGGYEGFSAYLVDRNRELFPAALMTRARSHFLGEMKFSRALDFGAPGNWLLLGNEYSDENSADGRKVLVLQNTGALQDVNVKMNLIGANGALPQVYDCFGNPQPWQSTLAVGRTPLYVVAPASLKIEPQLAAFGKNIAAQARVLSDDSAAQSSSPKLSNGLLEFDFHDEPERTSLQGSEGKVPLNITLQWSTPQTIRHAILYGSLADNDKSTPLAYEVFAKQNGAWKKVGEVSQNPSGEIFPIGTIRLTNYDNPWIFLHTFPAPLQTDALRFHFTRTTRGQYATDEITDALAAFLKPRVELREVQVFAQ